MVQKRELSHREEVANSVSHGIGTALAIAALIILLVLAVPGKKTVNIVGFSIYGATLILLYLASTLYHSFSPGRIKDILRVFDHASIFLLIAGTYTPITLIALRGVLGWTLFGVVWGIALLGIVFKIFWIQRFALFSTILYALMGWMIVFAIKPLLAAMSPASLTFLLAGGLAYSVGIVFYLWKSLKYSHMIWHIFVLAGSVCHFFTIVLLLPK
jgi:hemolysin III